MEEAYREIYWKPNEIAYSVSFEGSEMIEGDKLVFQ
jgi:hypothetical protein